MTLIRPPALPYETEPDEDDDRLIVERGDSVPGSVLVGPQMVRATRVATTDRLPLAAAIAGDAGVVFAVPEGGLPQVKRLGDRWTMVDRGLSWGVADDISDEELLANVYRYAAFLVARAEAETAAPLDPRVGAAAEAIHAAWLDVAYTRDSEYRTTLAESDPAHARLIRAQAAAAIAALDTIEESR